MFRKAIFLCFVLFVASDALCQRRRAFTPPPGVTVKRDVVYGKGGGRDLKLDLYLPEKKNGAAIVCIHGGGWGGGDKRSFAPIAADYASQGYVAVSINYRLSGEAPFPAAVEDCKCAVRWLRAHAEEFGFDLNKIGATGSSAGGHLALMLGLMGENDDLEGEGGYEGVSSRVQAVVSFCGPTTLTNIFHPAVKAFLGGDSGNLAELGKKASPLTYVSSDDPPVMMVHGTADKTVPYEQSVVLEKALKEAGVEVELITVEGGGHAVLGRLSPDRRREIQRRVREFFAKHLGVKPISAQ